MNCGEVADSGFHHVGDVADEAVEPLLAALGGGLVAGGIGGGAANLWRKGRIIEAGG